MGYDRGLRLQGKPVARSFSWPLLGALGRLLQPVARGALVAAVAISASVWSVPALARGPLPAVEAEAALPVVALAELPNQARQTYRLILAGGPFPYEKDGTVFGNRERLLPRKPRGHYREYTVPTPGSRDRGARRMVCAGEVPKEPEACFYSDDHYASFRRVAP